MYRIVRLCREFFGYWPCRDSKMYSSYSSRRISLTFLWFICTILHIMTGIQVNITRSFSLNASEIDGFIIKGWGIGTLLRQYSICLLPSCWVSQFRYAFEVLNPNVATQKIKSANEYGHLEVVAIFQICKILNVSSLCS